jgi:hypothetical protein
MDPWRNSRELEEVRSIHIKDFAGLLNLRGAHHCLHPLSWLGVHGGQHARTRQRRREESFRRTGIPSANMLRQEGFTLMSPAATNTTPCCLIGGDLRNRTLPE